MGSGQTDSLAAAVDERPRFRPRWLLHLLWTLPVAAALSVPAVLYGAINICGISGCTGGGFGVSYGPEELNWVCAAIVAVIFVNAIAWVPWARPWWIHVGAGAVVGLAVGALLIATWLGAKYQYYPAGVDCYPATSRSECEYGF